MFKNVAPEIVVCKNLFRRPLTWELLRQKIDARDAGFFQTEFIEYLMIPEDFGTLFMSDLANLETPVDYDKIGELNAFVQSLQQSDREQMLVTLGKVVVGVLHPRTELWIASNYPSRVGRNLTDSSC